MVHEQIVYFLFRWGQAFIDALVVVVDRLNTPISDLPHTDVVFDFIVHGLRIGDYSVIDLLFGPGLMLLLYLSIYRLIEGK